MEESPPQRFRLMTYNVGGGRRDSGSDLVRILEVVRSVSPDILVVQEATDHQDADGRWFSVAERIAQEGGFGSNYCFGPTLSMRKQMHTRREIMVHGLFADWQDWRHGNAIFCRWGFSRLGDKTKPGTAKNVPLYQPPVYEGSRDTDPRYVLLARVKRAPIFPFIAGVHLSTLSGERGLQRLPGKVEQARGVRLEQARRFLDLVRAHILERGELLFLLGDFNAAQAEPCIAEALCGEGGFVRLKPSNGPIATHPKVKDAVDHILVSPAGKLVDYCCWVVDDATARAASDHLPVVAEVTVR